MKKLLLLITLCLSAVAIYAHGPKKPPTPEQCREFREFKLKFLAQEMELKEDQRERFIEIYDKMEAEKRQVFSKVRQMEKKMRSDKDISDDEYDRFQAAMTEARERELAIDRKYDSEFLKILSRKQLFKMKEAEGKFREKMREMRGPGKGKRGAKGHRK